MVQQCMQEDLQHLQDYYSGRPTSAEGGFRCQQRRLVLPACAAAPNTQPPLAAPAVDASLTCQDSRGRDGGDSGSITVSVPATACSRQPCAGDDGSAPAELQAQGSAVGSLSRAPSGWLSRSGSGSSNARTGSGWRSYRRRLAPSCKELMYVCDGDRNGVVHYIATGEAAVQGCMTFAATGARAPHSLGQARQAVRGAVPCWLSLLLVGRDAVPCRCPPCPVGDECSQCCRVCACRVRL